ncbi:MAG: hypothetical protein JWR22_2165 [Herminiimonas sp.]|nr:hypothetical protein [Herminiimonas sp.]
MKRRYTKYYVERHETKRSDRGIIRFRRQTFNQRDEVVVVSTATLLMLRRTGEAPVA